MSARRGRSGTRFRALVAWMVLVASLACGPLDGLGALGGRAQVVGTVVRLDGTPSSARIHLVDETGGPVVSAEVDPSGAFALEVPHPGRWTLVAIASDGLVAEQQLASQSSGTTTVGRLTLLTAAEVPSLLDLHGLGLEEQRTHFDTGTSSVLSAFDGMAVVGAEGGVFRVPELGEPTSLAGDAWAMVGAAPTLEVSRGWWAGVAGCDWVTGWMASVPPSALDLDGASVFVLFDLERGQELWRGAISPGELGGERVTAGCSSQQATVVQANRGGDGRLRALFFERGGNAPLEVDLGSFDAAAPPRVLLGPDFVTVVPTELLGELSVWRLGQATEARLPGAMTPEGPLGERWLVQRYRDSTPSWLVFDPVTRTERTVFTCAEGLSRCRSHWSSATGTLWILQDGTGLAPLSVIRVDPLTGAQAPIELTREAAALLARCGPRPGTDVGRCLMGPPGLLFENSPENPADPAAKPGFVIDLVTGEHWTFEWPDAASRAWLLRTPSGGLVLRVHANLDWGDTRLYTGGPGRPLRRRTFMPATRIGFIGTATGVWYVRTDPRTSLKQVFFLEDDAR